MRKILLMSLCLIFLMACNQGSKTDSANDDKSYSMSEYTGLKSKDIRFKTNTVDSIITKLEKKEPGIYLVGFSDCPWCQSLVPVLNDVLISKDKSAYYLDVRSNEFSSDQKLVDRYSKFDDSLGKDKSEGSVPFLIVIDDKGKIQTHLGTVDGHDAYKGGLTSEQVVELKKILNDMIN